MLTILWLTGCAAPCPTSQELAQAEARQPPAAPEAPPAEPQQSPPQVEQPAGLSVPRMLASLDRVARLEPKLAKQLIARAQSPTEKATPEDRFELVLLLSQKGADDKSLKRALQLLDGLQTETEAPGARALLGLQRRNLLLEQQFRRERGKSAELQKKIEHLKGLERELDESHSRMEEPLNARPEGDR